MKKHSALISFAFVGMALIFPLQTSAFNLGTASEFNAFIFGDFTSNSDTEGRLAVGGNASLQGYSVGDRLSAAEKIAYQDTLIVGGDLDFTDGTVYGNAFIGGDADLERVDVQGNINNEHAPIDFEAEAAYFRDQSLELSLLKANGSTTSQWGGLQLSGTGTSDMQVFHLDGMDLLNANSFLLSNIAEDATLVFNVSGNYSGFKDMGMASLADFSDNILFNFYEADNLLIENMGVEGSILAPLARVNANNGQLEGTMIAASVDGTMEYHHNLFTGGGDVPTPAPVPEPSTLLLLAVGVMGLFGLKRRCKK